MAISLLDVPLQSVAADSPTALNSVVVWAERHRVKHNQGHNVDSLNGLFSASSFGVFHHLESESNWRSKSPHCTSNLTEKWLRITSEFGLSSTG